MTGAQLRSVEVDGQTIAYRQAGQGPALVLLHGFLCDSRCWRHQLSHLSDQFSVVAWDAPGAGSPSGSSGRISSACRGAASWRKSSIVYMPNVSVPSF